MKLKVRRMSLDDLAETIKLCNLCFEEKTRLEFAKKRYLKGLVDQNQIYLVTTIDEKIVGHMRIQIIETMYESMGSYAMINHVCVHPEYRRHKIATKMLDLATKICKDRNCKNLSLWSKNKRAAAHACYLNYGFEIEDAKFFIKELER